MTDTRNQIDPRDEAEIRSVLLGYVAAIDGKSFDRIADSFTDDTATLGNVFASYIPGGDAFNGDMPGRGGEAVANGVGELMRPLDATQHFLGAIWFEPTEKGVTTHTQVIAHHHRAARYYHVGGTYEDDFVRTGKGWRIERRVLNTAWFIGDPAVVTGD